MENALIAEGQSLWEAVAQSPHSWIGMACRLQSRVIYKNCFIHLVGRYQVFRRVLANTDLALPKATTVIESLPPRVKDKVVAKYNGFFAERCAYVESTIMTYYPPALRRTAEAGRKDYANDIFLHMALSLFRHWFGLQVIERRNHISSNDGGWAFYQELLTGGEAYLRREDLREWHEMFPMSGKGTMVLQNHLNDIKEEVRKLVKASQCYRLCVDCIGTDQDTGSLHQQVLSSRRLAHENVAYVHHSPRRRLLLGCDRRRHRRDHQERDRKRRRGSHECVGK